MRMAKQGDLVTVHYQKKFDDGSRASSRKRGPVEVIVGVDHPRLPGLGLKLLGMAAGEVATLQLSPKQAYGMSDPKKILTVPREQLTGCDGCDVGDRVRVRSETGGTKRVRILKLGDDEVVIDTNHRWAGMAMELNIEVVNVRDAPNEEPVVPQGDED